MQKISKDKKYRTRDGREVEILLVDERSTYGVIANVRGQDAIIRYRHNGTLAGSIETDHDLIEVEPERKEIKKWITIKTKRNDTNRISRRGLQDCAHV